MIQTGRKCQGWGQGEWKDFTEQGRHFKTTDYSDPEHGTFTVIFFYLNGTPASRTRYENGMEVEEFEAPEGGGWVVVLPGK